MATIPDPTLAAVERLTELRAEILGFAASAKIRRTKCIPTARDFLDGMISAYESDAERLKKVVREIATGKHPHRTDSTRPLWMVDPLGRNNPEEND